MKPLLDDAERGFLYTFAENKDAKSMGVFLEIVMILTTASVAIFVVVRARKDKSASRQRARNVLVHMMGASMLILCDMCFAGEGLLVRLPADILFALLPVMALTSSLFSEEVSSRLSWILLLFPALLSLVYIFQGAGAIPHIPPLVFVAVADMMAVLICIMFALALSIRITSVSLVMNSGNVWSYACFSMDVLYLLFIVIDIMLLMSTLWLPAPYIRGTSAVVAFLLMLELSALGYRAGTDSLFVLWQRHERRIVESMKMSQSDMSQTSGRTDELYGEIYARIVALFEAEKPYLNSELTINDVVKKIFTNKLYISRAISRFTGRNFCQFVNYYRVCHSVKIFRENPELKVVEMANQSGFNSTVSFSMAFRLYMSECPSDWCRKERNKLVRRKK